MKLKAFNFLLFAWLCFLCSCKESAIETPSLFFSFPKNESILWNEITVDLESSVQKGDKISLFLGDSLVAEMNQAPYIFKLNTKKIKDGEYLMRAASLNRNTKAQISIAVRNSLLLVKANNNQLKAGTRCFIFLTNKEGKTFSSAEIKNGEELKISKDDFPYDNFTLSEAYVSGPSTISVYSFQEVPRGRWTLLRSNDYPATITTVNFDFTDIATQYYFLSTSGDDGFLYDRSTIELGISKNPSQLFVREFNKPINNYKIVKGIQPNGRQTISMTDVTVPLSIEKIIIQNGVNKRGNVRLYGFTQSGFQEYYNLGVFFSRNGEIKIEYPGKDFSSYGSFSFYKNDELTINAFNSEKMSDLSPLKAEVDFKSNGPLSASIGTFGEIQTYNATWAYANDKLGISAYWAMVGSSGQSQTITLPELPTNVRTAASGVNITDLQFSNTLEVSNFGIATDYASYIKYISLNSFSSPYAFGKSWKEQIFTKSGSTNGRVSASEIPSFSDQFAIKK